jgi:NAD(P)-dependent dehydrogenase (short-subunit alcohol dehydrogenase family)
MASSGGTILITGPNGGLGIGFVNQLLKSPYATTHTSIYAVRDPSQANALKAVLKNAPQTHKHLILPIDLCSLDSIRDFAKDVNARIAAGSLPPIQALVLAAGSKDTSSQNFTKDRFERTFAVNYLANFLLTLLLLQSVDKAKGRVVYLGSTAAFINWGPNPNNFSEDQKKTILTTAENIARGIEEHPDMDLVKTGERRYSLSKLLMIEWM